MNNDFICDILLLYINVVTVDMQILTFYYSLVMHLLLTLKRFCEFH